MRNGAGTTQATLISRMHMVAPVMNDRYCHSCGQLTLEARHDAAITARIEILRQICTDRGWRIVAGDLVSERIAAELLGKSKGHLCNLRLGRRPIPCRRVVRGWMYALGDLAAVLENCNDE